MFELFIVSTYKRHVVIRELRIHDEIIAGEPSRGSSLFLILGKLNQNFWDVRSEVCAVDWGVIMSIIKGIDTRDAATCTWKGIL